MPFDYTQIDPDQWGALPWSSVLLAITIGYALGSIPFGLVLTRLAGLGDIRHVGSGNIGATNVLRTGHKSLALLTLFLDAGKAVAAVFITAAHLGPLAAVIAAMAAFFGHLFPVWLNFKGGKGVATYIGVLLALSWPAAALFCIIWLAVAVSWRMSSLAALTAASLTGVVAFFQAPLWLFGLLFVLTLFLIAKHRTNIQKIISGHESKIGEIKR